MLVLDVVLLIATVTVIAVGLHLGPHGSIVGGVIGTLLALGSIALVVSSSQQQVPTLLWLLIGFALVVSITAWVAGIYLVRHTKSLPSVTNRLSKIYDSQGVVTADLNPVGTVLIAGESWTAESQTGRITTGSKVFVTDIDGLRLKVIPEATSGVEAGSPKEQ
ncbi:MAG: NfeD family protein [Acidimicrobiaceae bacterium]|nr:NfeD family protein [Acidimicrobiaceae bacterium]